MKCSHCGAMIAEGTRFCAECGARIEVKSKTHKLVSVDAAALMSAVLNFKKAYKCNRIYLPGDDGFDLKLKGFMASAMKHLQASVSSETLIVEDNVVWSDDDNPRKVSIERQDVIAILDNTKVGFWGKIGKTDFQFGSAVTTKGIVTINAKLEGVPDFSGFLSWRAFVWDRENSNMHAEGVCANVTLFSHYDEYGEHDDNDGSCYPKGNAIELCFGHSELKCEDMHAFTRALVACVKL